MDYVMRHAIECCEAALEAPSEDEGGDYKDAAAELSSAIGEALSLKGLDRFTERKVIRVLDKHGLLNGYSCPRAFWEGWHKLLH